MGRIFGRSKAIPMLPQAPSANSIHLRWIFIYSPELTDGPTDDLIENGLKDSINIQVVQQNQLTDHSCYQSFFSKKEFELLIRLLQSEIENTGIKRTGIESIDVFKNESPHVELIRRFDVLNAFASARLVLTMYQRALQRIRDTSKESTFDFVSHWGSKLVIDVYAINDMGINGQTKHSHYPNQHIAYYQFNRDQQINKIDLGRRRISENKYIHACRNFDVIAHEVGHAVFTAIRVNHWDKPLMNIETKAIEESFADLTCVFALLNQMDVCQAIISATEGELDMGSFFETIGEELGPESHFVRKLTLDTTETLDYQQMKNSQIDYSAHDYSQLLSNAIYTFIVRLYNHHKDPLRYDPSETLYRVGSYVSSLVTAAIYETRKIQKLSFDDVIQKLLNKIIFPQTKTVMGSELEHLSWHNIMVDILEDRKIAFQHLEKLTIDSFIQKTKKSIIHL